MSNLIAERTEKPNNVLGNLSLGGSAQDLYRWTYKTEIAEMETVL
jgi:glutamate receptor ionotropic, NMDA 2B